VAWSHRAPSFFSIRLGSFPHIMTPSFSFAGAHPKRNLFLPRGVASPTRFNFFFSFLGPATFFMEFCPKVLVISFAPYDNFEFPKRMVRATPYKVTAASLGLVPPESNYGHLRSQSFPPVSIARPPRGFSFFIEPLPESRSPDEQVPFWWSPRNNDPPRSFPDLLGDPPPPFSICSRLESLSFFLPIFFAVNVPRKSFSDSRFDFIFLFPEHP